jgi:hypothetical protein
MPHHAPRFAELARHHFSPHGRRTALYAAGPSAFQRFLVPVYEARGRVRGGLIEDDVFNVYVVAVEAERTDLKRSMVRDCAVFRPVFTSF